MDSPSRAVDVKSSGVIFVGFFLFTFLLLGNAEVNWGIQLDMLCNGACCAVPFMCLAEPSNLSYCDEL